MSEFWTWEWFPANMCIGILSILVVLCGLWLVIAIIREIIDELFGQFKGDRRMSKCDKCTRGVTVFVHGEPIKCCPYVNNCPKEEKKKKAEV